MSLPWQQLLVYQILSRNLTIRWGVKNKSDDFSAAAFYRRKCKAFHREKGHYVLTLLGCSVEE